MRRYIDPELKKWATQKQAEYIDAINERGSVSAAAMALGVNERSVGRAIDACERNARLRGYGGFQDIGRTTAEPYIVKGKSTLYNKDGEISAQWVKTTLDAEQRQRIIQDTIEGLAEGIKPLAPVAAPSSTSASLANLYTMTDCHMGMLAWHNEGGADWDLKIAKSVLGGAFRAMLDQSPAAKIGFLNQLGDWLHADSIMPVTPTSGHILDTDGRFSKVVDASLDLLISFVGWMLEKHERVVVLMAEGNHDVSSSIWLRSIFKRLFADNPRVTVIDSPLPYYAYQHGKTMLAFHHGHLKKNDALPLLFASQFSEMWGATAKRYCHVGHRHHTDRERTKEHSGMEVWQHPTLAARDAYAARGGWHADRKATAVTYHDEHGEVATTTVTPEMLA